MWVEWTTAQIAIVISGLSFFLALASFVWNVLSKFIFPRPRLKITVNNAYYDESRKIVVVGQNGHEPPEMTGSITNGQVICIMVTNFGPVDCFIESIIVRFTNTSITGTIEPLADWPESAQQNGFFGSGLPVKLDVGTSHSEFILATSDLALERNIVGLGLRDGYGRNHFCSKKNMRNLQRSIRNAVNFDKLNKSVRI